MARKFNKFTARFVDAASRPGRHSDGGNLYPSVSPNGGKRWVFFCRFAGRQRELGLGSASRSGVSLSTARQRAADARAVQASGEDPLDVRRSQRQRDQTFPSFGDWADAYVETQRAGWRNKKHADQWAMTLTRYCAAIRQKPVSDIDTEDVLIVLQPIWESLPKTAQRLRGRIENVLDAAKSRGLRTGENPARRRGHLSNLLSKPKKLSRGHHAALGYDQVPAFIEELANRKSLAARALELTILTASRTSEVLHANWAEFDLDNAIWIIPEDRM